jgi:hypothetical protein
MSHRTHLIGETKYLYLGYRLDIGQQAKNDPPMMNQKSFMQNSMSAIAEMRKQVMKKYSEATVFRGDFQ